MQKNKYIYNRITLSEAMRMANEMYNDDEKVRGQILNSYAWDIALNFICQTNKEGYTLAVTTDSAYGNIQTDKQLKTRGI